MRHYEILACGCIPIFENLENCPEKTMFNFPKEIIKETNKGKIKNGARTCRPVRVSYYVLHVLSLRTHCVHCTCICTRM